MNQRNIELLEKTMQHIKDDPTTWDQSTYWNECGTPGCFAGWACHLAGYNRAQARMMGGDGNTSAFAAKLLGLNDCESFHLFNATNTLPELELMVKDLVNGDELRDPVEYWRETR